MVAAGRGASGLSSRCRCELRRLANDPEFTRSDRTTDTAPRVRITSCRSAAANRRRSPPPTSCAITLRDEARPIRAPVPSGCQRAAANRSTGLRLPGLRHDASDSTGCASPLARVGPAASRAAIETSSITNDEAPPRRRCVAALLLRVSRTQQQQPAGHGCLGDRAVATRPSTSLQPDPFRPRVWPKTCAWSQRAVSGLSGLGIAAGADACLQRFAANGPAPAPTNLRGSADAAASRRRESGVALLTSTRSSNPMQPRFRLIKGMAGDAGVVMLVGSRCPRPQENDEPA